MVKIVEDVSYLHVPVIPVPKNADVTDVYKVLMDHLKIWRDKAWAITANQLGYDVRAFIMKMDTLTDIFIVNPIITKALGEGTDIEGCLSLPGLRYKIKRPKKIIVQGFDQNWQPVKYKFHETSARVVCHEIDHLNGKLISDVGERVL